MNISAQIVCVAAILVWSLSIQNKKIEKILFFQFLANLLYYLEYFLLGATTAVFMNIISAFRCYVFYYKNKHNQPISKTYLFIFMLLVIIIGYFGYTTPISIIPVLLTLLYTICSWLKDATWSRIALLLAAFAWIFYNFHVGAFVGIIGNMIEISSGIISLYRFRKNK